MTMEITDSQPIKFYRPDLKFSSASDWPCFEEDHEGCDGIGEPWKCPCDCHCMTDEEIAAQEQKEAA